MKLISLLDHKLEPLTAVAHKPYKGDKLYYNVIVGDTNVKDISKLYKIAVDARIALPTKLDEKLVLDNDNYNIKPIKCKNKILKRNNNDICYVITNEYKSLTGNDYLVCWYIPAIRCLHGNVKYSIEGNASLIAEAVHAKERKDAVYSCPVPIIEIYGGCVLTWEAINSENKRIGQSITYNAVEDKFNFQYLYNDNK